MCTAGLRRKMSKLEKRTKCPGRSSLENKIIIYVFEHMENNSHTHVAEMLKILYLKKKY